MRCILGTRINGLQALHKLNHAKLIAIRIEEARYERGMSVAELGRRASIDRKRLWYILDGQRQMRADEFVRLCVVLDMGLRSFLTSDMAEELNRTSRAAGLPTGAAAKPSPFPHPFPAEKSIR